MKKFAKNSDNNFFNILIYQKNKFRNAKYQEENFMGDRLDIESCVVMGIRLDGIANIYDCFLGGICYSETLYCNLLGKPEKHTKSI